MTSRQPAAFEPWSERPRFVPAAALGADQLNRAHEAAMARQRLVNRAVLGWGVVFGLQLKKQERGELALAHGCLELGCGLALDRHGRELFWPGGRLGLDDLAGPAPTAPGHYTLLVHYAEREPKGYDPCRCDPGNGTIEIGVVFTLRCGCKRIGCGPHPMPEDACIDLCHYICARTGATSGPPEPGFDQEHGCREPGPLCGATWSDWRYDPDAGVPLACLELCAPKGEEVSKGEAGRDGCPPRLCFARSKVETCLVRPFVYRNPLLYDLARDNHVTLARVARLSWQDWILGRTAPDAATGRGWTDTVSWADFQSRVQDPAGFKIVFSRPIRVDTLHPASIILQVVVREWRSDYFQEHRIPFDRIEPLRVEDGFAWAVKLGFEKEWRENEIETDRSTLNKPDSGPAYNRGILVELVIRSALLRDRCGHMLDGRPLDIRSETPGQAMPGTDFVAVFRVGDGPASQARPSEPSSDQQAPVEATTGREPPIAQQSPTQQAPTQQAPGRHASTGAPGDDR
jgi:hypothetical protein